MNGNAMEWVWDYYAEDYYARSPQANPKGPDQVDSLHRIQENRPYVVRGGRWDLRTPDLHLARRRKTGQYHRLNYLGFRCARNPDSGGN